jgi:hypothetical protein
VRPAKDELPVACIEDAGGHKMVKCERGLWRLLVLDLCGSSKVGSDGDGVLPNKGRGEGVMWLVHNVGGEVPSVVRH